MDVAMGMRVFHAVVDAGSFTAAARKLDMSPAMVTRYVAQLESHLGARLLHRTTRKLSLTGIGADYFQRAVRILELIEEAGLQAAQEAAEPRGLLRASVPGILGLGMLDRISADFMRRFPQVQVELSMNSRVVDLVDEGFDLAVRLALPGVARTDTSLVARRLLNVPIVACAAPAYLRRRGTPRAPRELESHDCLVFTRSPLGAHWQFSQGGQRESVKVSGPFRSDEGRALVNVAVTGGGIVYEPAFLVAQHLRAQELKQVLPKWDTPVLGFDAVWPTRKFMHPKVRAFVDFLAERLAREPSAPGVRAS